MSVAVARDLSEKDKAALRRLLSDEDSSAIRLLEEAFVAKGEQSVSLLSQVIAEDSEVARNNAKMILIAVKRDLAIKEFTKFCAQGNDLETGAFLLAETRYPTISRDKYCPQLDEIADQLRLQVSPEDPQFSIQAINHLLFERLKFRGNKENYYDPDNSYINRVMDRRTGIPITLSTLYLFLTTRLGLPVAGVGMPGHFILKWEKRDSEARPLFIDPFNRGNILTEKDCADFLGRSGFAFSPEMLAVVNSRRILARMCNNLVAVYRQTGEAQLGSLYEKFALELSR